jgi:hypothetical protein
MTAGSERKVTRGLAAAVAHQRGEVLGLVDLCHGAVVLALDLRPGKGVATRTKQPVLMPLGSVLGMHSDEVVG